MGSFRNEANGGEAYCVMKSLRDGVHATKVAGGNFTRLHFKSLSSGACAVKLFKQSARTMIARDGEYDDVDECADISVNISVIESHTANPMLGSIVRACARRMRTSVSLNTAPALTLRGLCSVAYFRNGAALSVEDVQRDSTCTHQSDNLLFFE